MDKVVPQGTTTVPHGARLPMHQDQGTPVSSLGYGGTWPEVHNSPITTLSWGIEPSLLG